MTLEVLHSTIKKKFTRHFYSIEKGIYINYAVSLFLRYQVNARKVTGNSPETQLKLKNACSKKNLKIYTQMHW